MVALPVAADVRRARSAFSRAMRPVVGRARGPALVALGAAETTGVLARTLPRTSDGSGAERPVRALPATPTPRRLMDRGEATWEQITARPEAADLISRAALAAGNLAAWLENTADELHDLSEETLGRLELALRHRR